MSILLVLMLSKLDLLWHDLKKLGIHLAKNAKDGKTPTRHFDKIFWNRAMWKVNYIRRQNKAGKALQC